MSLCQVFIVKVVPTFFNDVIDGIVGSVVKDVDLNQPSSVADIQKYLNEMIDLSDNFCVQGADMALVIMVLEGPIAY